MIVFSHTKKWMNKSGLCHLYNGNLSVTEASHNTESLRVKYYISLKLECQSGGRTHDIRLSKLAALTTAPWPGPVNQNRRKYLFEQWEAIAACCARQKSVCQGEITKFDRFVDPNVRGAKRRVYSDQRIFCNMCRCSKIWKLLDISFMVKPVGLYCARPDQYKITVDS